MKKIKMFTLLVVAFVGLLTTGCIDKKSPQSGYLSEDEINEIVSSFSYDSTPLAYSYEGNLNYFGYSEDKIPASVKSPELEFVKYPLKSEAEENDYLSNCASYYLRLPLQITKENWNQADDAWSTRYQIESKLYRTSGNDSLYYYQADDGGLIIKAFGVNKELIINNEKLWMAGNCDDLIDIACSGKWNITVIYNAQGLLVLEDFSTVNASQSNLDSSCFGKAEYTYF